jgi:hypothetical protein
MDLVPLQFEFTLHGWIAESCACRLALNLKQIIAAAGPVKVDGTAHDELPLQADQPADQRFGIPEGFDAFNQYLIKLTMELRRVSTGS